jgi:hypothetical protein
MESPMTGRPDRARECATFRIDSPLPLAEGRAKADTIPLNNH